MRVEQLMVRDVQSVRPEESLEKAARLMDEFNRGCTPVVDAQNHVVGMLTDRDICMAAWRQRRLLTDIKVRDVMITPVQTCSSEDTAAFVAKIMENTRVRRLPVLDEDGELVGIISLFDLAREAEREVYSGQHALRIGDLGTTLLAVSGVHGKVP